ncbi:uncharacterized protein [Rutidosis leptorrhynchoides]|uniref:uncharacterized protein n=1 Tax=Rutidosis leptorrhynchoides TaxID=125765 RepID=UPI003A999F32
MKTPAGFLVATMAAASATTVISVTQSNGQISHQEHRESGQDRNSSMTKTSCCSEKFAPRYDGLRFIETLVTAHR